jgi:hypothetical protein
MNLTEGKRRAMVSDIPFISPSDFVDFYVNFSPVCTFITAVLPFQEYIFLSTFCPYL